ncbi:hypothetical protein ABTK14_24155, partial [Acinetobacter baumannii]
NSAQIFFVRFCLRFFYILYAFRRTVNFFCLLFFFSLERRRKNQGMDLRPCLDFDRSLLEVWDILLDNIK